MMEKLDYITIIKSAIITIILVFILIFTLTYTHIVPCKSIGKTWCDVYYGIVGPPKILVVYGNDGLGNAEKLDAILNNKALFQIHPQLKHVDTILTLSYLKNYDLVIVTQAKTLSNNQIQIFYDYVNSTNGVLIWTGDAGTNYLPTEKKASDFKDLNLPNHPWVRVVEDNKILDFRTTLSAEYLGNFCSLVTCSNDLKGYVGNIKFLQTEENSFASGIAPGTNFSGDFGVVTFIYNTSAKVDLAVDYGTVITTNDNKKINSILPLIIRGQIGKKVVYSAMPLEYYIDMPGFEAHNTGMNLPLTTRYLLEEYLGYIK